MKEDFEAVRAEGLEDERSLEVAAEELEPEVVTHPPTPTRSHGGLTHPKSQPGGRPRPAHLWKAGAPKIRFQSDVVIVKLRPNSEPVRAFSRGLRSGAATEPSTSVVSRLLENGYAISADPVFDVPVAPSVVHRHARFLAAAVEIPGKPAKSRGLVEVVVDRSVDPHRLAADLSSMGGEVEYALVPAVRRLFARRRGKTGPDPLASRQWAHGAIRIAYARSLARFNNAASVTVAVVDSGIDKSHPDLKDSIAEYKNFLKSETDRDFVGHGTHVSGIVAAGLNNAIGIGGICASRILALKALPRNDQDFSAKDYYRALRYTIGRAQVLNLSLGGDKDEAEIDVLRDVIDAGVVVVAAMGNEFEEGNPVEYPAAMPEVCAVGATDQLDRRATFSNTGLHIDIVAPGVEILSTTPTHPYDDGRRNYDSWDGTSMATPHVAAAAALVLAKSPKLSPKQVIAKLKSKSDRVAGMGARGNKELGSGRLNIENALR